MPFNVLYPAKEMSLWFQILTCSPLGFVWRKIVIAGRILPPLVAANVNVERVDTTAGNARCLFQARLTN